MQSVFAEDDTFTTTHFSGSGNCSTCHDGLTDTGGNDVSIARDWGSSMMAHATKDPLWQAKVASELKRNPDLSSVLNDKCSQCHAPAAHYEITEVQSSEVAIFGAQGILDTSHALHDSAMNGVTCTACHQIEDTAELGTLDGFSGHYSINDSKHIYGQFSDIVPQPMINNTGFTPTYSAHISDSKTCATCHNLKTPFVDANGDIQSTSAETEFPEQMPYTEWENSVFADDGSQPQSCQDCHMPKTTSKVSNRPDWLVAKNSFAQHHLAGANTVMLTMLKNNATQFDVISGELDQGINRARSMLQSAVSVTLASVAINNGNLEAAVRLTNLSGHKAPTSFPSRRMWLHFKVTDSQNNVLFESGKVNPDGSIVGSDNDADSSRYEPHYDQITSQDQVQIYETIMGNSDNAVTYTLLRGSHYLKDNRLTPQGFDKISVPDDVAVRGEALNDDDFNLGVDEVLYRFPVTANGELAVSVDVYYQPLAHGFVQDLFNDADIAQVQAFKTLYEAQTLKYELMSNAVAQVSSQSPVTANPSVVISATPESITEGETSTLTWQSEDVVNCTASGDWSGNRAWSGTETVTPSETSVYILTCTDGSGGNVSDQVSITVNASGAPVNPESGGGGASDLLFLLMLLIVAISGNRSVRYSCNQP
ncbi:MAG: hypothetical protein AB2652_20170 [Candidatus Thiodiazotropha endolucinida]